MAETGIARPLTQFRTAKRQRSQGQQQRQEEREDANKILQRKDGNARKGYGAPDGEGVGNEEGQKIVARFIQYMKSQRVSKERPVDSETLIDVAKMHASAQQED